MNFTRKDVSVLLDGVAASRDLVAHQSSYFAGALFVFSSGIWVEQGGFGRCLCEDSWAPPVTEDSSWTRC
jgi:hypothetical protein